MKKKLSLAIGAAALLSLGTIAATAHAGEPRVHALVLIQAPMLAPLLAHFEPYPAPPHVVRVAPAYDHEYEAPNHYRRHGGYRDGGRWDHYRHGRRDRDYDDLANRYARDRDGDGVPNYYDRRPDNPTAIEAAPVPAPCELPRQAGMPRLQPRAAAGGHAMVG